MLESNSLAAGSFFSGPHLFSLHLIALLLVKIPQPGDSKGIFSASTLSCHVLTSDPNGHILNAKLSWSPTRAKFSQLIASLCVLLPQLDLKKFKLEYWL